MSWKIQSSQFQRSAQNGALSFQGSSEATRSQEAKAQLHGMALNLVGSDRSVKSGYLKLVSGSDGALKLGTRWFGSNGSTRDARDMVRSLIKEAYGNKPGIEEAINSYLQESGSRLGTQSFVKLVQALEAADHAQVPDPLSNARVKDGARLDTSGVDASFKWSQEHDKFNRLASLLDQAPRLVERVRVQQNLVAFAQEVDNTQPLGRELAQKALQLSQLETPAPLGEMGKFIGVNTLVALASQAKPVSSLEREAVLRDMPPEYQDQLLKAFGSHSYDQTVLGLLNKDREAPGTGAHAAMGELRDIEKSLLHLVAQRDDRLVSQAFAPAPADLPEFQAEFVAPVTQAVKYMVNTLQSDHPLEMLGALRQFEAKLEIALEQHALSSGMVYESEDQQFEARQVLLTNAMSAVDEHAAATALRALRESGAIELAFVPGDITRKASGHGGAAASERMQLESNRLEVQVEQFAHALTMRVRGHSQPSEQLRPPTLTKNHLMNLSVGQRAALWRAFPDRPNLSLADFDATVSEAKKLGRKLPPQGEQARYRATQALGGLDRLPHLQSEQRAQLGQLLAHPSSLDRAAGSTFIQLLTAVAPKLLQETKDKGSLLSDAEIWQAVLGEPAPEDLQGMGDLQLAPRLVQEIEARYQQAAIPVHARKADPAEEPPQPSSG